jgi:hypothetical protein
MSTSARAAAPRRRYPGQATALLKKLAKRVMRRSSSRCERDPWPVPNKLFRWSRQCLWRRSLDRRRAILCRTVLLVTGLITR